MSDASEELRSRQAPLKERYREDAAAAVIVLKASASLDAEGIACRVETGRALVEAGLHPATGGSGLLVCSGDMLLEALAACAGVTLPRGGDSAGNSGARRPHRGRRRRGFSGNPGSQQGRASGFKAIRLRFLLDTNVSPEQLGTLLKLTERYCVVLQTLRTSPVLTATVAAG